MPSAHSIRAEEVALSAEQEARLRLYRRLWIAGDDLDEARSIIEEVFKSKLRRPRSKKPSPLLIALTTALVVAYARPFVNSRGPSNIADRTVPGKLLQTLTSKERQLHDAILDMRNREVAHSDAEFLELTIELFPSGDGVISRVSRDPLSRLGLHMLHRMINKLTDEIELRCDELRGGLPHNVWL
jgi:hypothetical protein